MINPVERSVLLAAFLILIIFNIIVTFVLYFESDVADMSKVERYSFSNDVPLIFSRVSNKKTASENALFVCVIIANITGFISALWNSPLGLSFYCLFVTAIFFLGTSSIPLFIYFFRFILDMIAVTIALVLRSNLIIHYCALTARSRL